MKKTRFTEQQILFALKQGLAGQPVADVCRQMGISEATYYVWKKRYTDLGTLEVREFRQLRDANARLKRLVADLTLDRHVLQEVIKKRFSHRSTPRHRQVVSRVLSPQHPSLLRTQLPSQRDVVLPVASEGQQCAAAVDTRARAAVRPQPPQEVVNIGLWTSCMTSWPTGGNSGC